MTLHAARTGRRSFFHGDPSEGPRRCQGRPLDGTALAELRPQAG
ncbi:hypothetical protein [Streptomyces sp. KM273126]|nr:hypothetical protein [Streptomyces sp. KM273126]